MTKVPFLKMFFMSQDRQTTQTISMPMSEDNLVEFLIGHVERKDYKTVLSLAGCKTNDDLRLYQVNVDYPDAVMTINPSAGTIGKLTVYSRVVPGAGVSLTSPWETMWKERVLALLDRDREFFFFTS